jgi:carboxyl-terminal processing protease
MNPTIKRLLIIVLWVGGLAGAFASGAWLGDSGRLAALEGRGVVNTASDQPGVDFSSFWRSWELLDEYFVNSATTTATSTVSAEEKVWGAIEGLADSYDDPYTTFLAPEENRLFKEEIKGKFGGVGMEIDQRDDLITVVSPLPDTPAKRAGLQPGDKILEIDGQSTLGLSTAEAVRLIRGEVGTVVKLKVLGTGGSTAREVNLTRAIIAVPTLETELLANKVFVIRLFSFGDAATRSFRQAMKEFAAANTDRLILDLRGNPGGYLDAAIDIAGWFVPKGETVVIEDRGAGREPEIYESEGPNPFGGRLKMAVLVDGGSASASEIVAGALQEHGLAVLVGEQTFGKGSVQELFPVADGAALKITIARWLTPGGLSISPNGLTPDVVVKPEARSATSTDPVDRQLEAAVAAVSK